MKIVIPPEKLVNLNKSVFLAGSIEQDKASKWQDIIIGKLKQTDLTILNPRRENWDSSWKQEIDFPEFNQQVNWELDALEIADLIVMYFDPKTKSPVTLLELGLFAKSGKLIVCCPEGFWRKGNVDIVCIRFGIQQVNDLDSLTNSIKTFFNI